MSNPKVYLAQPCLEQHPEVCPWDMSGARQSCSISPSPSCTPLTARSCSRVPELDEVSVSSGCRDDACPELPPCFLKIIAACSLVRP